MRASWFVSTGNRASFSPSLAASPLIWLPFPETASRWPMSPIATASCGRANRDGSDRVQLTSPPLQPISLDWSPDGSQLVFTAQSPQGREQGWIVSARGGTPQRLLPEDSGRETDPSWSPDGRETVFATGVGADQQSTEQLRLMHSRPCQPSDHHTSGLRRHVFAPLVSRWSIDQGRVPGPVHPLYLRDEDPA